MNTWKTRGLSLALTGSLLISAMGISALAADGTAPAKKTETVFVVAEADGTEKEVIVSEWLQNDDGASTLRDSSDLTDIQVVKGDAEQSGSGSNITWQTGGGDVYYQGTSTKELPVSVAFTYELDGKKLTPEELEGKSGKLKITITYENRTEKTVTVDGEKETMAAPFLMATGLILDSGNVQNVEVKNGTVETDGDRTIILGCGMPGLGDSLKLEELAEDEDKEAPELPESVEITADVTDFEPGMAVTVATCGLLKDLDLTGNETRQELEDALTELGEATEELMDGTEDLLEGASQLQDGTGELLDGAEQLDDGAGELQSGGSSLQTGAGSLDSGAASLQTGAASLNAGIAQIQQALAALDAQSGTLTDGSAQVKQALLQIQTALRGVSTSTDALTELVNGSGAVVTGLKELEQGAAALQQGVSYGAYQQILQSQGIDLGTLQTTNSATISALDNMIGQLDAMIAAAGGSTGSTGTDNSTNSTGKTGTAGVSKAPAASQSQSTAAGDAAEEEAPAAEVTEPAPEEAPAAAEDASAAPEVQEAAPQATPEAELTGDTAAEPQLQLLADGQNTVAQLKGMRDQLVQLKGLLETNNKAIAGTDAVANAYLTGANYQLAAMLQGVRTMETEYAKLHQGILTLAGTLSGLSDSMGQLSAGIDLLVEQYTKLDDGTRAYTGAVNEILAGQRQLSAGAAQMVQGTGTLKAGTMQLYTGAGTLVTGIGTLKNGTASLRDGAAELRGGAGELQEGAEKLRDGMKEYKEDGIETLLDLYFDNVPKLIARLEALQEVDEAYQSFAGVPEGTESSVRYVIRTE